MNRKLKALGLALCAAFALSAVAASAASAETPADFAVGTPGNPSEYPAIIDTTGDSAFQTFHTAFGKFTCAQVHWHARLEEESPTLTATEVSYTGCHATFLQIPMTFDMNGCGFIIHVETMVGSHTSEGSADVHCPENKEITITVGNEGNACTLHIPGQELERGIVNHNLTDHVVEGTGEEVDAVTSTIATEGITMTSTGGSACAEGTDENVGYTGELISTATKNTSVTTTDKNYGDFLVTGTP